jgi:hypothetical protein
VSLSTLTKIAAQRDSGPPKAAKKKPEAGSQEIRTEERSYLSTLVAAIPTEPLALYTFLVATIVATIGPGDDKRLVMRWILYGVTITLIVAWIAASYLRNRDSRSNRRFPVVEALSASVAFAAWGLAMPESPLNAVLSTNNRTIWTAIVTAAGVVILGMLGKPLKEKAKKRVRLSRRQRKGHEVPGAVHDTKQNPA